MEGAADLRPLRGRPACSGRRKPPITAPGSPAGRLDQESGGVDSSSWWRNPRERRDRRGARLTRRVREEYLVYFDRNATMSGAQRRGSAGMDRRPNAAWVSLPVVGPGWIAGRAPTGRTGPRGFHHRLLVPNSNAGAHRVVLRSAAVWTLTDHPLAAGSTSSSPLWMASRTRSIRAPICRRSRTLIPLVSMGS